MTTLYLVVNTRLEVIDAHFTHVGEGWELFGLECLLILIELLLDLFLAFLALLGISRSIRLIDSMAAVLRSFLGEGIQLNFALQGIKLLFEMSDLDLEKLAILSCIEVKSIRYEFIERSDSMVLITRRHQVLFGHSLRLVMR